MASLLQQLLEQHRALVRRIHAFRYPLSPRALNVARVVYFVTPIYLGHELMQWAMRVRDVNLGANRELLLAAAQAAAERRQGGGQREPKAAP
jgi:hypothetical protein